MELVEKTPKSWYMHAGPHVCSNIWNIKTKRSIL